MTAMHPDGDHSAGRGPRRPRAAELVRAIRRARGVTLDGFAAHLGYSQRTVRRWEHGEAVPDATAEAALEAYCREHALFRPLDAGLLAGVPLTPELLRDALAATRLSASRASPHPPLVPLPVRARRPPTNLPTALTSFVGRERELAGVRELLTAARLVTLVGPGGAGKTRLALTVAASLRDDYPHGAFLVDLAPLRDPALVIPTIARTLGVREGEGRPLADSLLASLAGRRLLLLLDNVEHLPAAAPQVARLLAGAADVTVLATGRAPLHVSGEHQFPVPPLPVPDTTAGWPVADLARYPAVHLFLDRARAALSDLPVTDEVLAAVAGICARLDGLPLAIELAAARVAHLPPAALLARLEARLPLLVGGPRDLAARQRTLRATLDWSHDLLAPAERVLFRRLAVFVGGWTLEGAEAVCTGDGVEGGAVLELLAGLADQSLLTVRHGPGGGVRYGVLETVHEYARERLEAAGEGAALGARHAAYFLRLAEDAADERVGAAEVERLGRLEREHDNLRAALGWWRDRAEVEQGTRLVHALRLFWSRRGDFTEARAWGAAFLALPGADEDPAIRARLLAVTGFCAAEQGDVDTGLCQTEEAVALFRRLGDRAGLDEPLRNLAYLLRMRDVAAARAVAEESVALARSLGNQISLGLSLNLAGLIAVLHGDLESGRAALVESRSVCEAIGYTRGIAFATGNLAYVNALSGDGVGARAAYAEALELFRAVGSTTDIAGTLVTAAVLLLQEGEEAQAAALLVEGLRLNARAGAMGGVADCLEALAGVLYRRRDNERTARLLGAAARLRQAYAVRRYPPYDAPYEAVVAAVRKRLGEAAFAAAWAAGQALTPDVAIADALAAATA